MSNLKKGAINVQSGAIIKILLGLFLFVLVAFTGYLLYANTSLSNSLKDLDSKKEAELQIRLKQEKIAIKKDLDEKYAADMVSFAALAKRSQIERKRVRELEKQVEELKEDKDSNK